MKQKNNLAEILKRGIKLNSSGTTGPQKKIYQSPMKIKYANEVARESQKISKKAEYIQFVKWNMLEDF